MSRTEPRGSATARRPDYRGACFNFGLVRAECERLVTVNRWRFENLPEVQDDQILQAALVGAWRARGGFDPQRGTKFTTYIQKPATGAIVDLYRAASRDRRNRDLTSPAVAFVPGGAAPATTSPQGLRRQRHRQAAWNDLARRSSGVKNINNSENSLTRVDGRLAEVLPRLARVCLAAAQQHTPAYVGRQPRIYTRHQLLTLLLIRQWTHLGYGRTLRFVRDNEEIQRHLGLARLPRRATLSIFGRRPGVATVLRRMEIRVRDEMRAGAKTPGGKGI